MISPRAMFETQEPIEARAPAKINLFLEITGERPNGYHDICSALVPISIYDRLFVRSAERGVRTRLLPGTVDISAIEGDGTDNLVTRAGEALAAATGYTGGAVIALEKHIPIGGGLGGGSSDAAACLIALNDLWGTGMPLAELAAIGSKIGCDVPGLLYGGPVRVTGLGEIVARIGWPGKNGDGSWWLVVVNPKLDVSTGDIYARYSGDLTSRPEIYNTLLFALESGDLPVAAGALFNDLQETVVAKYPLIGIVLDRLSEAGALGSLVCGSGASVFGLARGRRHAEEIEAAVTRRLGDSVWTRVARTLPDGVMVAHGPLEA